MASELVSQLVDAGIHYGHRVSRWNPKMLPYIFGKRNAIHIVDIRETVKGLLRAKKFITRKVAGGEDVLYVGTKRQARPHIMAQAERVKMPWVAERWLGGMLTNFRTIRSRLGRLEELETEVADGTDLEFSKKMRSSRAREMRKIKRNLDGVREMNKLPGVLIVIDVHRERNAVREARKLGIPTVCLIDTDSDPAYADLPIPGNDDAMRAIEVILIHLTDAVEEGLRGRQAKEQEERRERAERQRASSEPADEPAAVGRDVAPKAPAEAPGTSTAVSEAPPAPAPKAGPAGPAQTGESK